MLISAILLTFVKTYLTFDFPIPFERPEVAFHAKRLSKYYDLESSTWRDSEAGLKQPYPNYDQMLAFCQDMYPDRDVVRLHQGPPRTLKFCKIKDNSKCADFDIVTWICVSRDELNTASHTASPASTASHPVAARCLNQTTQRVAYERCTDIETAIYSCSENTTFNKMDNVQTCNITISGRETSGLLSADLGCCAKEESAKFIDTDTDTDTIQRRPGPNNHNPFNPFPWTTVPPRTVNPPNADLPPEWCGLEQVEAQRRNITEEKMEIMKEIYTQNEDTGDLSLELLVDEIQKVERDLNMEVVELFKEHFSCLAAKVQQLVHSTRDLLQRIVTTRARDNFARDIQSVNSTLTEVREKFDEICSNFSDGESNDFNKDYREVVTDMQELRVRIETISEKLSTWKESGCLNCPTTQQTDYNCVHCPTTKQIDYNTLPPLVPGDDIEQEEKADEETKLKNQKYLIAIVSTVSVITIIVALVFFIVVVRRTLHKDVAGRFSTLPSAEFHMTQEQYVAFLQKNGYQNPTCRLPQKYLDDHD